MDEEIFMYIYCLYISACNVSGKMVGWEKYRMEMGRTVRKCNFFYEFIIL